VWLVLNNPDLYNASSDFRNCARSLVTHGELGPERRARSHTGNSNFRSSMFSGSFWEHSGISTSITGELSKFAIFDTSQSCCLLSFSSESFELEESASLALEASFDRNNCSRSSCASDSEAKSKLIDSCHQRRSDEETTEVWDRPKKYMENAHNESTCAIVERSGEIGLRLMSTPSKKSKVSGMSIDEMFTICPQCNVSDEKMRTRSQGKLRTLPSCCLDTVHARRKRNSAPRCCQEKSKDGLQYTCISQNCRMNKKRKLVF
jgi:hypothetical protein